MRNLSFQEKMLYAQLAGLAAVVFFYAHYLLYSHAGHHYFHAVVLALLLLFAGVRFVARRRSPDVIQDERDRAVASLGDRWSNLTLWIGLVVILTLYWDHGSLRSAAFLIGILFHLLLLAGIVRILRELIGYRQAA